MPRNYLVNRKLEAYATKTMSAGKNNSDQWQPCRAGQLRQAMRRIQIQQRNRVILTSGSAAAVLLIVITLGALVLRPSREPSRNFGNISCAETKANLRDYMAGKLDESLRSHIKIHLANCPDCGPSFKRMNSKMAAATVPAEMCHKSCNCATCRENTVDRSHSSRPIVATPLAAQTFAWRSSSW